MSCWLPHGFLQAERDYLDPDVPHFCYGEHDRLDYDPDELYVDEEEFEDVD